MAARRNTRRAGGPDEPDPAEVLGRPLTARSVLASLLLGRHPPSAPVGLLVRWCSLFGISGTSARVALSRMVERGELSAERGVYTLAGRIRGRQAEQDFALAPTLLPWNGMWTMAVVQPADESGRAAMSAAERTDLRGAFTRARMVPLRDGVWARPDNLPAEAVDSGDRALIRSRGLVWTATSEDARVVSAAVDAYDVDEIHRRGHELLGRLVEVTGRLPDPTVLAEAFVVGAASAQHLRRDPLLPGELLPADWPGDDLRAAYASYLVAFGRAVAAWSGTEREHS